MTHRKQLRVKELLTISEALFFCNQCMRLNNRFYKGSLVEGKTLRAIKLVERELAASRREAA